MPVRLRHVIHNVIYSVVIVGGIIIEIFLLKEMKDNDSLRQEVQVEEVGVVEEVNEEPIHILTDSELSQLYSLNPQPINDACLSLTVEDAQALMKIAVVEDNTDAMSQAKIMSVILNRLKDPNFPNTIVEIIEQEGQFSTKNAYKSAIPDTNSHEALYLIESGQIQTDYLYFEATWVTDSWQSKNRELAEIYDGTRYYR